MLCILSPMILQEMLDYATDESLCDLISNPVGIYSQPRLGLSLEGWAVCFNVDYATDIFSASKKEPQGNSHFVQTLGPADENWAVNNPVSILLGIKKQPKAQVNSHFVQALLQTLKMAGKIHRVFLTPRLVIVKELTIAASYVAELIVKQH
ncbi:hypothetical protein CEK25_004141 [Fusarium fujikuroi]|nr:hypothetical protein CEK25_004141 [Fusarium fujikuroi]